MQQILSRAALVAIALSLTACASAYYGAMEKIGYEKRDILVDRVKDAREEQAGSAGNIRHGARGVSLTCRFRWRRAGARNMIACGYPMKAPSAKRMTCAAALKRFMTLAIVCSANGNAN